MADESNRHIAWKDRLGLNRIWEQCILVCCKTFGTDDFIDSVDCFRATLVNVRNGPQLKTIVDDYFNGELNDWQDNMIKDWIENNRSYSRIHDIVLRTKNEYKVKSYQYLLSFMIQTLEDHGFGFYQSEFTGEYDEWK